MLTSRPLDSIVVDNSTDMALLERRLETLKTVDADLHERMQATLARTGHQRERASALAELVALLTESAIVAPDCCDILLARWFTFSAGEDWRAVRRWFTHGLRLYEEDVASALHHFERGNPEQFTIDEAQQGDIPAQASEQVQKRFRHILSSFGFTDISVKFHSASTFGKRGVRPTLSPLNLHLPRDPLISDVEHKEDLRYAAVLHAVGHLIYSPLRRPPGNRPPILQAILGLIEDARVERLMMNSYPALQILWGRFHVATREQSGFDFQGLAARLARALHDPVYEDSNNWVQAGRLLFEEAAGDLSDHAVFTRIARDLTRMLIKLQLPFDSQKYCVEPPYRDDNAALWLSSDDMPPDRTSISQDESYSLSDEKTGSSEKTSISEVEMNEVHQTTYPEWDHALEELRPDWVTVIDRIEYDASSRSVRAGERRHPSRTVLRTRGRKPVTDRSIRLSKLHEGDELDLDAALDSITQLKAGRAPDPRVFRRHGRSRRPAAVLLLMDLSKSTDRFVPGSFITVLDLEKKSAGLLVDLIEERGDRIALHGFDSNGRNQVNYTHFKDFQEPFGSGQQALLDARESGLSTRMGGAIRHATALLKREQEEKKILLLITDGAPSDIDIVDDEYLVEDAREAVRDALAQGVQVFCLTLDQQGDGCAHRIFGLRRYLIVDSAEALTSHLMAAVVRLVDS